MDGIEINTSLGKSKEEVSSLKSEEVVQEATEVVEAPVVETEETIKEEVVEQPTANENNESQPPAVEEKAPEISEDLVRSKAKDLGYFTQEDVDAQKQEWLESQQAEAVVDSDFITRARELQAQGYDLNDHNYWDLVTRDYGKYDLNDVNQALDVVLEGYKLDYPNVSEAKLRAKLENDYDALYDDTIEPEDREHKKLKLI